MWKRPTDFAALLETTTESGSEIVGPAEATKTAGAELIRRWNEGLPDLDDADALNRWHAAISSLRDDGVIVVRHRFNPWEIDPETEASVLNVCTSDGSFVPLSALSPLVRVLREAWLNDVQVQAFSASSASLDALEVLRRLSAAATNGGRDDDF
jgi:hypothetical protein